MDLPLRVLIVCTANSARSQMAEAMLHARSDDRVRVGSAGTHPAERVNPFAIGELRRRGIEWSGTPKSVDAVLGEHWDIVITVCDSAKESCPVLPGVGVSTHWGVDDPAAATGSDRARQDAFRIAADVLSVRIDAFLALPIGQLDVAGLRRQLDAIGTLQPGTEAPFREPVAD